MFCPMLKRFPHTPGPSLPSPDWRLGFGQLSRFFAAGVVNTTLGLIIILGLDIGLGAPSALANAAGYAFGITFGWLLQRRFVFRSEHSDLAAKGRYLVVVAMAFGLNQLVLWTFQHFAGQTPEMRVVSQVCAVGTYSLSQFVLLKLWVFRPAPNA
jgi:putative flippase GtrA